MIEKPVTPTRIIPAGQAIPTAPPLPPAPHDAEDLPPWRTAAPRPRSSPPPDDPPPPSAPETAQGGEQRVVVEVCYPPPETEQPADEPHQQFSLAWARQYAHPWRSLIGAALALLPIPGVGYSAATIWAYTVGESRQYGIGWAYVLALGSVLLAGAADYRRARIRTRFFLVVAFIGCFGAIDWYDPITFLTGVHR